MAQENETNPKNSRVIKKIIIFMVIVFISLFLLLLIPYLELSHPKNNHTSFNHSPENFQIENQISEGEGQEFQIIRPGDIATRFSDIAGQKEVKEELKSIIEVLHHPEIFTEFGATPPKGLLLYGPPGTGKTLMARALAGESDANFINVSGSEFVEEYVGKGALRIRRLFQLARENPPCIIFIDEFDALASTRSKDENREYSQTVNQLLAELDNLDKSKNENLFVIAATNNISLLDKAVLRPGRFDKKVWMGLPNLETRKEVISHILKMRKVKTKIDINQLAETTKGFSPAELDNLINQALISMIRQKKKTLTIDDLDAVKSKVLEETVQMTKSTVDLDFQLFRPGQIKTNFSSIVGLSDVKDELKQMIEALNHPEILENIGAKLPKGWLFYGPPGTGKTSLARAVAGEGGVNFITTSGSSFIETYVGTGALRVRELFEIARQYAPCILFIDEIDALASKRQGNSENQEYAQTVNQFLTELDNLDKERNQDIVVIGATNQFDLLDEAVIRPGRLGKKVYVRLPNLAEREQLFKMYIGKIKASDDVKIKTLAELTMGFSGADIENLINEAALYASEKGKDKVSMSDILYAQDIITLGRETKTANVAKSEREITAYHEAGHALVGILSKNYPYKFNKISIGIRENSLGVTSFLEHEEHYSSSRESLLDTIATMLAGKIAETMKYGENYVTSGPSQDLQQATLVAQDMVTKFGLGKKGSFIAYQYLEHPPSEQINEQIESILKEGAERAQRLLSDNKQKLDDLAKALMEKDTLTYDEVMRIINKK